MLITLRLFPSTELWERIAPVLDHVYLEHYLSAVMPQASRSPKMREPRLPVRRRC